MFLFRFGEVDLIVSGFSKKSVLKSNFKTLFHCCGGCVGAVEITCFPENMLSLSQKTEKLSGKFGNISGNSSRILVMPVSQLYKFLFLIIPLRETCRYLKLFWSTISGIHTEYSVQMRENGNQNKSKYGHFLGTVLFLK